MGCELKHECAVALVVMKKDGERCRTKYAGGDFGGTKLSLLLEKQHNRGQDGAGAAILHADPEPGQKPYWIAKSASETPLADVLKAIGKRDKCCQCENVADASNQYQLELEIGNGNAGNNQERIFLGHLRYATFGKNDVEFCHPFVHEAGDLAHTLLLAGNFNLTNAATLFDGFRREGAFPTSKSDGYLVCELIAHGLENISRNLHDSTRSTRPNNHLAAALSAALKNADGAWALCGMTGDGWAFATRDPHGIRPLWYFADGDVFVAASERPAIQAAFDVPPEAVKEVPPGSALVVSPEGEVECCQCVNVANANGQCQLGTGNTGNIGNIVPRPCSFERIYFSRANDADIHRERLALGAALVPQILEAAEAPLEDVFFSYIPNSARIAFHGLIEELIKMGLTHSAPLREINLPRFGEVIVKDAKFRTFIADAAARREFYKHIYDVTYGLVRQGKDTLVVLDDSIVRGNTMKNAILPMLDRLGPKRIVIASSAPPIRYPDCYGIDMSTLGELVAFKALVNLLNGERGMGNGEECKIESVKCKVESVKLGNGERELREVLDSKSLNPLAALYARFTEEQHCAEIARLLTPPGMKAEVKVVYQTVENLRRCLAPSNLQPSNLQPIGDWYFTGDYPTPGGYRVLRTALENYLERKGERSY